MLPEKCSHSDVDHINKEVLSFLADKIHSSKKLLIDSFLCGLLFSAEDGVIYASEMLVVFGSVIS
jgi:hypothetical protein